MFFSFLSTSNFLVLYLLITELSGIDASPITSDSRTLSERGAGMSTPLGSKYKLLGYTYVVKDLADEFNAAKTITSAKKAVEGNHLQKQITESGYMTVYAEPSKDKTQKKGFPDIWVCTIGVANDSPIRKKTILRVPQSKLSPWKTSEIDGLFRDKELKATTLLFPLPDQTSSKAPEPESAHGKGKAAHPATKIEVTGELLIPGTYLNEHNPLGIGADCVELSQFDSHDHAADWTSVLGVSTHPTTEQDAWDRYMESQFRY